MKGQWTREELAEHWTLDQSELALLANKAGPTRLGFAVLLKAFGYEGRFPRSKHEIPGVVVVHLARQVGVPAELYPCYEWSGRMIEYHRAQIRASGLPRGDRPGWARAGRLAGRARVAARATRGAAARSGLRSPPGTAAGTAGAWPRRSAAAFGGAYLRGALVRRRARAAPADHPPGAGAPADDRTQEQ